MGFNLGGGFTVGGIIFAVVVVVLALTSHLTAGFSIAFGIH